MTQARDPYPRTYLTIANRGFPNWFEALGPNAGLAEGNLLITSEKEIEFAIKATKKLQKERLKSIEVKQEAVDDFDEYLAAYFPRVSPQHGVRAQSSDR